MTDGLDNVGLRADLAEIKGLLIRIALAVENPATRTQAEKVFQKALFALDDAVREEVNRRTKESNVVET